MAHRIGQERLELRASPAVTTRRQRTQRVAMIALPAGNHMGARSLTAFHMVLPRQFDRGLNRLRPTGDEIDAVDPRRRPVDQLVRQTLCGLGREKRRVRPGDLIELRFGRLQHGRCGMAQTGHRRPAARIEVALAICVHEISTITTRHGRQHGLGMARKHMGRRGRHRAHLRAVITWLCAAPRRSAMRWTHHGRGGIPRAMQIRIRIAALIICPAR